MSGVLSDDGHPSFFEASSHYVADGKRSEVVDRIKELVSEFYDSLYDDDICDEFMPTQERLAVVATQAREILIWAERGLAISVHGGQA